jgi:RNA polymerase sigma factor (sigma-70 family)
VSNAPLGIIGGLVMIAPLSAEEERRLHPIIQKGRQAAAILSAHGVNDPVERNQLLLQATCGLVRTRVVERGYHFGNEDLEAAGIEGLVNALRRFNPELGTRFSTYANYWIMKLVNQAVQQQAGLSDSEMRLVLQLRKFERSSPSQQVSKRDVAQALGISQTRANEVMQMNRDLWSRRFEPTEFDEMTDVKAPPDPTDAPPWVIDALRRLCGGDFDSFWQYTFHTMSLDEIARKQGITRQGMSKRIERCRRAVRESPEAQRLQEWFDQQ